MSTTSFVHLHTHSEFSLLDGAARLDKLVKQAANLDMPALALTDHGVMYGSLEFYRKCKDAGIKPIIGVEAYVAPKGIKEKASKGEKSAYHLLLLARNHAGYKNLLKLTTIAAVEGFYSKPRVDHEILAKYSEGLIATSACLGSEINAAILRDKYDDALATAGMYRDLFGPDNFYIELQDHTLPEQHRANEQLLKIAHDLKLPIICSNDVHYLTKEDAYAHDVLLCIGTGSNVQETNRLKYGAEEFYMKSGNEMAALFPKHGEAVERTLEIAERCNLELEFGRAEMPVPYVPEGLTPQEYLRQLALEGMHRKVGHLTDAYRERLDYELGVVEQTGFAPYFLIVRDFAKFAHDKEIFFGVRGSAAGSLTSFSVDITEIDPVEYELTFERFLNPERIQMPDIDMDFEDSRRSEVIEYVTNKYGADHVAQIITFGTLAARAAIKDAGRALAMPLPQVNNVVGMIPTLPIGITIERALNEVPEMKAIYQREPEIRNLIDTAKRLEGISRHASVHAAGVVISHDPLVEYTPLQRSAEGGLVTQYGAGALETIGLLKMDFLGLINLSILGRAVANIEKSTGKKIDVGELPLDDKAAYEVLGRGETTGVFQLESDGMRRYITQLKPTSVRELAAMIALYRPGPMAHIPTYIRAKHDPSKIKYPHKALKEVLEETYGVIVYQDQVMRIAQVISGYTLGQADLLRRAMGKKKKEVMAAERANFLKGADTKGIDEKSAGNIFDLIEPFAGYAFNKAHAVCYAMIAYQTAYLKANYPVDYMAALLASFIDKPDKMAICLEECRRLNVELLPPCVNRSDVDFQAENGAIRFGLAGIKNVGRAAVDVLLAALNEGEHFRSIDDLCNRLAAQGQVSRSTVEALVQSGALGDIHPNRRALMELVESATTYAARTQQNRRAGQESLFGGDDTPAAEDSHALPVPNIPDFPQSELLKLEKDLLGVYLSGHPLQRYRQLITKHATTTVEGLQEKKDKDEVWLGGIISAVKPFRSKKSNEMMAYFTLEDLVGNSVPVTVFPSVYRDHGSNIDKDKVVIVHGRVQSRENVRDDDDGGSRVIELLADEVRLLAAPRDEAVESSPEQPQQFRGNNGAADKNGSEAKAVYVNGSSNGNTYAHLEREQPPRSNGMHINDVLVTGSVAVHVRLDRGVAGLRTTYHEHGAGHAQELLKELRAALSRYPGEALVMVHAHDGMSERTLQWDGRVTADKALIEDIEAILGHDTATISGVAT